MTHGAGMSATRHGSPACGRTAPGHPRARPLPVLGAELGDHDPRRICGIGDVLGEHALSQRGPSAAGARKSSTVIVPGGPAGLHDRAWGGRAALAHAVASSR